MEHKFEFAARTLCLSVSFDLLKRMKVDARHWPVREERLLTLHTFYCESSKSLEGDLVGIECDNAAF